MITKATALTASLALAMFASTAHANDFVFVFQDLTDSLYGVTYENGTVIQDVNVGPESYGGLYGLGWDPNGVLASDVSLNVNILEANGAISDTWQLFGSAGSPSLNIPFQSDVDGQTLAPLANAISVYETGQPQAVLQFTLANGDNFTWEFQSDASGVPEPATWTLTFMGLAGLGVALRSRRRTIAATA